MGQKSAEFGWQSTAGQPVHSVLNQCIKGYRVLAKVLAIDQEGFRLDYKAMPAIYILGQN